MSSTFIFPFVFVMPVVILLQFLAVIIFHLIIMFDFVMICLAVVYLPLITRPLPAAMLVVFTIIAKIAAIFPVSTGRYIIT